MKNIRSFSGIALSVMMLMSTMPVDAMSWKAGWNAAGNLLNSAKEAVVNKVGNVNVKEAISNSVKNTGNFFAAQTNNVVQTGKAVWNNIPTREQAFNNASAYVSSTANGVATQAKNVANVVKDVVAAHPTATKIAAVAVATPVVVAGAVKGTQAVIDYKNKQQKKLIVSLVNEILTLNNDIKGNIYSGRLQPFKINHDWSKFEANLAKLSYKEFAKQLNDIMKKIRNMYDVRIDYTNNAVTSSLINFAKDSDKIKQSARDLFNELNNQKTITQSVTQVAKNASGKVANAARFAGAKVTQAGQAIKQACGNVCSKVGSNVAAATRFTGAKTVQAGQAVKQTCWNAGCNTVNAARFAGSKVAQAGQTVKNAVSPYMTKRNALIAGGIAATVGAGVAYKTGVAQAVAKEIKNLKHVNWTDLAITTGQKLKDGAVHCGSKIAAGVTGLAAYLPTFAKKAAVEADVQNYLDESSAVDYSELVEQADYIDEAFDVLQEQAKADVAACTVTTVIEDAADYMQPVGFAQDGIVDVVNPADVDNGLNSIATVAKQNIFDKTMAKLAAIYQPEVTDEVDGLGEFADAIATNDATADVIDTIALQAKNDPTIHQILF